MTSSPPTVFRHTASADRPPPGGSFGLAPELLTKARARVRWFAVAMTVMSLIGVAYTLTWRTMGLLDQQAYVRQLLVFGVNAAVAGAVWWLVRTTRFSDSRVLHLGLFLEFWICLGAAIGTNMATYAEQGVMGQLSWVTPVIILFPLIVPYPSRRMLVVSLIVACTEPISVLIMWFTLEIPRDPRHFEVAIQPVLAAGLAYFAARVIWGLSVEVTRARRIGSYSLEELLGRGGMGEVWRASHKLLARPAAVKLIHPEVLAYDSTGAQAALMRFEQEAQATASLRSPHTIELYDFGRAEDGSFYYVMELLEGLDLSTLVEKYGPQEPARVTSLLMQACHSLEEAHRAGLIHRDVKPANMFVCRYGIDDDFVKVLDFGMVKTRGDSESGGVKLSADHSVFGTPAFMAPEQVVGDDDIDGRTDLYALGCVGYWLLTGQYVFPARTAPEMMALHLRESPEPPSALSPLPLPAGLEQLILRCLEKDPELRPQSADEVAARLSECPVEPAWTAERAREWWDTHSAG
jgi:serine/threonine-protein kinase